MRLTKRHKEILENIGNGPTPFPGEFNGFEALKNNGLLDCTHDARGNVVLIITEAGRALLAERTKHKAKTR